MLCAFGLTLFSPPVMIFRFAVLQDKTIKGSLAEKRIYEYCRTVTIVWCAFFVVNGGLSFLTIIYGSDALWVLYNCFISYILMGSLFAVEFIVRKMTDKKMPKSVPVSKISVNARDARSIVSYKGSFSGGDYKTWHDFMLDTAILRAKILEAAYTKWILHCEDAYYFLSAFTALLQCKKKILLTANITPEYIAEIRDSETAFLTDISACNSISIQNLLDENPASYESASQSVPPIDPCETNILMFTSGTSGKPKVVDQRLSEFEADNGFILSKWGDECLKRKFCSTVSHHHIFGLLFSVLLPFTAGVPFRRSRIDYPQEFKTLTDDSYMIITVPAFLKRACELDEPFNLNDPWIFTSGGSITHNVAEKTEAIFKFWPLEVYGSTETSGIAWRKSKFTDEWTPFDNAQLWKQEDGANKGCLVVRSPYIKDPAGFLTGDLVEFRDGGKFVLKGRADSVVKIEEKRISLPEVETRIMQSGLVSEAAVIAMEDKRQYLAAALVLNENGKTKFINAGKFDINKYFQNYLMNFFENVVIPKRWRYVEKIPLDAQGKKKKQDIEQLFAKEKKGGTYEN
jgi:acyl-coenzyme A synthetase/AMP-(fatty) acid ligase